MGAQSSPVQRSRGSDASLGRESSAAEGTALLAPQAPGPALAPQRNHRATCKCPPAQTLLLLPTPPEKALLPGGFTYIQWLTSNRDPPCSLGYKKPSALWAKIHQCVLVPKHSQALAVCRVRSTGGSGLSDPSAALTAEQVH